jgi:hypothetical protein
MRDKRDKPLAASVGGKTDAQLRAAGSIEIRGDNVDDPHGGLDEIFGRNCWCHLEKMNEAGWCLIIEAQGRKVIVSLGYSPRAKRGHRAYAFVFADDQESTPAALADSSTANQR